MARRQSNRVWGCAVVSGVPCACGDMHAAALARPSVARAACDGARLRSAWPLSALLQKERTLSINKWNRTTSSLAGRGIQPLLIAVDPSSPRWLSPNCQHHTNRESVMLQVRRGPPLNSQASGRSLRLQRSAIELQELACFPSSWHPRPSHCDDSPLHRSKGDGRAGD